MQTDLITQYKDLINVILPSKYQSPVKYNHCFNRIILDWLFKDCWYHHLEKSKTAISQLNNEQFRSAIARMKEWLSNYNLLVNDNLNSLQYRKNFNSKKTITALPTLTLS